MRRRNIWATVEDEKSGGDLFDLNATCRAYSGTISQLHLNRSLCRIEGRQNIHLRWTYVRDECAPPVDGYTYTIELIWHLIVNKIRVLPGTGVRCQIRTEDLNPRVLCYGRPFAGRIGHR